MTAPKTKTGTPVRDFNDAGTEEAFTKGKPHEFEVGAHANYLAAGLIEDGNGKAAKSSEGGDKPA